MLALIFLIFPLWLLKGEIKGPFVINTWAFNKATDAAFKALDKGMSAIDGVVEGCSNAEDDLSINSVGFGGSPSETGTVTLDALLIDGETMNVGAVAGLSNVKGAIRVAQKVLLYTKHSILVGKSAAEFAISCGFKSEELENDNSKALYFNWIKNNCQPNYRTEIGWNPDPAKNCGPYKLNEDNDKLNFSNNRPETIDYNNHDSIGMITIDKKGKIAAGTSTNGAIHKINGRIGDSPLPGAGAYAKKSVGAAVATGDGDIALRYSLTFRTVLLMEQGYKVKDAIENSLESIQNSKSIKIAIVAVDKSGNYAAGCIGFETFPFSIRGLRFNQTSIITIHCAS